MNYSSHPLNNHAVLLDNKIGVPDAVYYWSCKNVSYDDLDSGIRWGTDDCIGICNGVFGFHNTFANPQLKLIKISKYIPVIPSNNCLPCNTLESWHTKAGFNVDEYILKCCEVLGISLQDIKGKSRQRDIVNARKMIALHIRNKSAGNLSLGEISRKLSNIKDHAKVLYWFKKAEDLLKIDPAFLDKYRAIDF